MHQNANNAVYFTCENFDLDAQHGYMLIDFLPYSINIKFSAATGMVYFKIEKAMHDFVYHLSHIQYANKHCPNPPEATYFHRGAKKDCTFFTPPKLDDRFQSCWDAALKGESLVVTGRTIYYF